MLNPDFFFSSYISTSPYKFSSSIFFTGLKTAGRDIEEGDFMMMENCERHDRNIDGALNRIMGGKAEYGFKKNERKVRKT